MAQEMFRSSCDAKNYLELTARAIVESAPRFDMADVLGMYGCHDYRVCVGIATLDSAVEALHDKEARKLRYTAKLIVGWLALSELALVRAYEGLPRLEASALEITTRAMTIGYVREARGHILKKWGLGVEEEVVFGRDLHHPTTVLNGQCLGLVPALAY